MNCVNYCVLQLVRYYEFSVIQSASGRRDGQVSSEVVVVHANSFQLVPVLFFYNSYDVL